MVKNGRIRKPQCMVHSCHQREVHAMFANKLIQGSKLKKLLSYARNALPKIEDTDFNLLSL